MATTLLKKVTVCAPGSKHNDKVKDVLIKNGKLSKIAADIKTTADETVKGKGLLLTPGWFDLHVQFHDPGREHKEDLESGSQAAQNGGFTGVLLSPDTFPACDTKSVVEYMQKRGRLIPLDLRVAGALSIGLKGSEMSEMYDMSKSGVTVFHDDKRSIQNPDFLRRVLLYSKSFQGRVMSFSEEEQLTRGGVINEGVMSSYLGLKAMPSLAESVRINRDLFLAEYCEAPIHFSCISCKESVDMIRAAKKRGMPVTCDVPYMNLVLTERDLESFDSNLKLNPPLRTERDRKALIKGLKDGTIDAVTSDHSPQNPEEKDCAFDHAAFGMSSIETLYPVYQTYLSGELSFDVFVKALTEGPDKIIGRERDPFQPGADADFTLVNPESEQTWDAASFKSRSINNYWKGRKLKGKVVRTFTAVAGDR